MPLPTARARPRRHFAWWTTKDLVHLMILVSDGHNDRACAERLGRSVRAVRFRRRKEFLDVSPHMRTREQLATELGCSWRQVYDLARRLELKPVSGRHFTRDQAARIREAAGGIQKRAMKRRESRTGVTSR